MMRIALLIFCFFAITGSGMAQTGNTGPFSREITVTTENDAYLFQKKDAYYTNGFFVAFRSALERNGKKIVASFELGQMIFTPLIRKIVSPAEIDRPYCGLLSFKYSQTLFTKNHSVLQYNAGVGEVGKASFGENVQNSYHKLLGYSQFNGWQYQVENAFGADLGISYARTVYEDSSWIKIMPLAEVSLGLNFTNAKLGTYLCLGSFEKNSNSALWNARVQTNQSGSPEKTEFFFYWYPQFILQGYNATVEGGLLAKGTGTAMLRESERWMFQQSFGLCYAKARFTTNLSLIYQSKEAVTQNRPQQYGSVRVSYRMH